jgi:hypothetical protein
MGFRRPAMIVIGAVAVAAGAGAAVAIVGDDPSGSAAPDSTRQLSTAQPQSPPSSSAPSSSAPAPTTPPAPSPPRPRIVQQQIPYPPGRKAEMANYARRHYGVAGWRLRPQLVVLHFTASGAGSEPGVHSLFAANQPNHGELPGVCAHFVVDQDGTIYQQAPLRAMCRHAIGLNDRAIGIEMIQKTGPSAGWADQQILHRPAQRRSVIRLVRWLLARYHIPKRNVIGHAMANDSPFFHDLLGWRNDHTDWQPQDVAELRRLL